MYILRASFLLQINTDWRPDLPSLVLGAVLGVLVVLGIWKASPFFKKQYRRANAWVHGRVSWMRAGVEVRFQGETADYSQKLHLGNEWADLTSVFMPPQLTAPLDETVFEREDRGATHVSILWPEVAGLIGAPVLPTMTLDELLRNGRRVLVSGQPGMGKSTLLAFLNHRLAVAAPEGPDKAYAEDVPLLLHLAEMDWTERFEDEAPDPLSPLASALQKRSSPLTAPGIRDMLTRKFEAGQAVLLLDGWDEMNVSQRPLTLAWLRLLLSKFNKTRVFMSTDLEGYGELLPFGFSRSVIMPWRVGEAAAFREKWTTALALEAAPELDEFWKPGQTALQTSLRFWQIVFGEGDTPRPLTETDLLTATYPIFQKRKKGEPITPPAPDLFVFWQKLALQIKQNGDMALSREAVADIANALSPGEEGEVDKGQANRLRKSLGSFRLFGQRGSGIGFVSSVWLDYFTAVALVEENKLGAVKKYLAQKHWLPVWRYYAGCADPAELVDIVMKSNRSQESVFQMAVWLRETKATGKWQRQTMIDLGQMARRDNHPPALRLRALATMVQTGEEGLLKYINQLLGNPEPLLRQMATAVLPLLSDDKVIAMMAERLADEDPIVRQTAVYSLALLQHNPLTERPLITALIGEDEEVGLLTADLLARNGGPGIQILKEAVEDEDIQVRRSAVHGLALIHEEWVEPMLVNLERHDDEWFVRSAANGALETIRKRKEPQTWRPVRAADQPWLEEIALRAGERVPKGKAAVEFVIKVFNEADEPAVRIVSAELLAQLPAPEAIPVLQQALKTEEDTAVRNTIYFALTNLKIAYPNTK